MAAQGTEWANTALEHERQVRRVETGGAVDGGDECRERVRVEEGVERREVVFAIGGRDVHTSEPFEFSCRLG